WYGPQLVRADDGTHRDLVPTGHRRGRGRLGTCARPGLGSTRRTHIDGRAGSTHARFRTPRRRTLRMVTNRLHSTCSRIRALAPDYSTGILLDNRRRSI